ncbi:hypothetical protein OKW36_001312 [Paraburkholderia sp. MM5482-R1]
MLTRAGAGNLNSAMSGTGGFRAGHNSGKGTVGIAGARLWRVMRRFFTQAADVIQADNPVTVEKLGCPQDSDFFVR